MFGLPSDNAVIGAALDLAQEPDACGLAGMLLPAPVASAEALQAQALAMGEALHHRGPDDGGSWVDAGAGIALAHRRLSILDLSPLGHQPMASADGRYVMAYNGEVYNFAALRAELEPLGHAFAAIPTPKSCWQRSCSGAGRHPAALQRHVRHRAVGPAGAVPVAGPRPRRQEAAVLRLGRRHAGVRFRTEALWQHPAFDNDIDRDALTLLLQLDYIPAPHSITSAATS
jgi:asparagine synthase (glutamine-hydrolysing)